TNTFALVHLNADGSPDTSFNPSFGGSQGAEFTSDFGVSSVSQANAVALDPLALSDDAARHWLRRWDAGNRPPKGEDEISKRSANPHQYGQRAYGSGRAAPAGDNGHPHEARRTADGADGRKRSRSKKREPTQAEALLALAGGQEYFHAADGRAFA